MIVTYIVISHLREYKRIDFHQSVQIYLVDQWS